MDKGPLKILVPPERDKFYVVAVDVAQNVPGGNFTCANVFEYEHFEQVAVWHGRAYPDEFAYKLFCLGHLYNTAFIAVEANPAGGGGTILSILCNKLHYPNLYFRERVNTLSRKVSPERPGWVTTGTSKPPMYNEMSEVVRSVLLEDEEPQMFLHDPDTVEEMTKVIYDPAKRGQNAFGAVPPDHDDISDSVCIAYQARKQCAPPTAPDPDAEFYRNVQGLGLGIHPPRKGDLRHRDKPRNTSREWCRS